MDLGKLVLIALTGALSTAHAGVVLVMDSRGPGSSGTETMEISVSGDDLRMDYGSEATMIFRGQSRQLLSVDHARRQYMIIDQEAVSAIASQVAPMMAQLEQQLAQMPPEQAKMMREMMEKRMGSAGGTAGAEITVARSGDGDDVNGYDCEWWNVMEGATRAGALCMTDTGNVEGGDEFLGAMRGMASFYGEVMNTFKSAGVPGMPPNPFAQMDKMQGVPVANRQYRGSAVTSESELRSATSKNLDAGLFEPPPDYRRQEMTR